MKAILTDYLDDLKFIHASGRATDERSYYPPLGTLFSEVGDHLSPKIVALHETADEGEGHPDFLLQVQATGDLRAAVEVKGAGADLDRTITSTQVGNYLSRYGLVLVTNLRDFALVEPGRGERREVVMRYALAGDEASFWSTPSRTLATDHAERFGDFLASALTYGAPISRPDDLADALARYAREALRRLDARPEQTMSSLRDAISDALGLHFQGDEGEHFFRSSLVQTLFYGLFSAWVVWNRDGAYDRFRWQQAGDHLSLPLVRELFERLAIPHQLEALDIRGPLEWAEEALNRTEWAHFAQAFGHADGGTNAVNYFYEPFLAAFDPELRKELGVWYTPPEIVEYMVARVDTVLREELGVERGLADPNVIVLDPACGTGAYLVEVLRQIAGALPDDGLRGASIRQAAAERVYGFEILPAPFVIAHLQVGMLLQDLGVTLGQDRAGVYLTNALTGWRTDEKQLRLPGFPALAHEAEAASHVKLEEPIIVVLGNPPYNGFAGVALEEERDLSDAYRTTQRAPKPQGQGLNDLYVRFYRMAERQIVERQGRGVVCFISNYSWLDGLSFTGMRERYLEEFDQIWIDCLNGDKYRTGKTTPWGDPDPSVFSTPFNREGIQVGTAVGLLVRREEHGEPEPVRFRNLWGTQKREKLIESLNCEEMGELYEKIRPPLELGLPFYPVHVQDEYYDWLSLPDLLPQFYPGVKTNRDSVVIEIDQEPLVSRMQKYFDPSVSDQEIRTIAPRLLQDTSRAPALPIRRYLEQRGFLPDYVVKYCYRPFDVRWIYWEPETKFINEKSPDFFPQAFEGNRFLEARQRQTKDFDRGYVTTLLADNFGSGLSSFFPLYLRVEDRNATLFDYQQAIKPNLSGWAIDYITDIGVEPEHLFYHTVAVLHAPTYRTENTDALRQDWPRIPLPDNAALLQSSAELGRTIAALLDPEQSLPALPDEIRKLLPGIAVPRRADGGQINPETDLVVNVNWGYLGAHNAVMPGGGRHIERPADTAYRPLGATTLDVYLNDVAYWENVPAGVWEYTLGGYQVIKKWLSYRETDVLGRPLKVEEVRYVQEMAQRIAAILLLGERLDENYEAVKQHAQ